MSKLGKFPVLNTARFELEEGISHMCLFFFFFFVDNKVAESIRRSD